MQKRQTIYRQKLKGQDMLLLEKVKISEVFEFLILLKTRKSRKVLFYFKF